MWRNNFYLGRNLELTKERQMKIIIQPVSFKWSKLLYINAYLHFFNSASEIHILVNNV